MAASDPITPQPRRFAIRLPRPLWIGVATVGLVIAGIGLRIWLPYYQERQEIQRIESWGGKVGTEPAGPEWLRKLVGNDRLARFKVFDRISKVDLDGMKPLDAALVRLCGLMNLRELRLSETAVSELELAHLSRCKNLEYLALNRTAVADASLRHLSGLTNLKYLSLKRTEVTDAGLVNLKTLTKLEHLGLYETAVTDSGISELRKSLNGCNISY